MRCLRLSLVLVVLLANAPACVHPPPTVVTPQGQTAYTADAVVIRVNELMHAAITANATVPPGLDTATTRILVQFCVAADLTLAQTPAGFPATLQAAWAATKAQLPPVQNLVIVAAMSAVDIVVGGLQP